MIAAAREAARAAGDLLRDARPEAIRTKGNPKDLVTEWDVRSEDCIRGVLAKTGVPVVGEEGDKAATGRRWRTR